MISTGMTPLSALASRPATPGTPYTPGSALMSRPPVTKKRRYPHYPEAELKVPEPGSYSINCDYTVLQSFIDKWNSKLYLSVKPENLRWTPMYLDPAAPPVDDRQTARIRTTNNQNEPERMAMSDLPAPPQHLPTMMNSVDPSLMDPELRALPASSAAKPMLNPALSASAPAKLQPPPPPPPPSPPISTAPLILQSPPKNRIDSPKQKLSMQQKSHQSPRRPTVKRPRILDSESDEDVPDAESGRQARRVDSTSSPRENGHHHASSEDISETSADAEAEVDAEGEVDEDFAGPTW